MVLCLKARESRSLPGLPATRVLTLTLLLIQYHIEPLADCRCCVFILFGAGWSSPVARQAHNLKVVGSNPTPATKYIDISIVYSPPRFSSYVGFLYLALCLVAIHRQAFVLNISAYLAWQF